MTYTEFVWSSSSSVILNRREKGHLQRKIKARVFPLNGAKTIFLTMVLKLYGAVNSTCSKRVAIVLHEKKVPFEFHIIDFKKAENKSPEYLKKQPFGQIPYIVRIP